MADSVESTILRVGLEVDESSARETTAQLKAVEDAAKRLGDADADVGRIYTAYERLNDYVANGGLADNFDDSADALRVALHGDVEALRYVQQEAAATTAANRTLAASQDGVASAAGGAARAERDAADAANASERAAEDVAAANREAAESYDRVGAAAAEAGDKQKRAAREATTSATGINASDRLREGFGDTSTATGAAASVLNAFGSNVAGEASAFIGDATGFLEYVPALRRGLTDVANQLTQVGPISKAVSTALVEQITAQTGLGVATASTAVSLGLLTAAVVAVAIPVAAAVAVHHQYSSAINAANAQMEQGIGVITAYYQAVNELTSQQAEEELATIEAQQAARLEEIAALQELYGQALSQEGLFGPLANLFYQVPTETLQARLQPLNAEFLAAEARADGLRGALASGNLATNDAIDAEERLTAARSASALAAQFAESENPLVREAAVLAEVRALLADGGTGAADARAALVEERDELLRLRDALVATGVTTGPEVERLNELLVEADGRITAFDVALQAATGSTADATTTLGALAVAAKQVEVAAEAARTKLSAAVESTSDAIQRSASSHVTYGEITLGVVSALDEATLASHAARVAEEGLAGAREREAAAADAARDRIDQAAGLIDLGLQIEELAQAGDAEGLERLVEARQQEAARLQALIGWLKANDDGTAVFAERLQQAQAQLRQVNGELNLLGQSAGAVISAAIRDLEQAAAADIAKIQQESAAKINQLLNDLATKEAELLNTLNDDLQKAADKAEADRQQAAKDKSEKLADVERDLGEKRLQIQRRANATIANAIASRDVLAAFLADQQRRDELRDADEAAKRQRDQIQRDYEKQLRVIRENLATQERELRARYSTQLQQARANNAAAVEAERERGRQEVAARQATLQQQVSQLQQFSVAAVNTLNGFQAGGNAAIGNFASQGNNSIVGFVNSGLAWLAKLQTAVNQLNTPSPSTYTPPKPEYGPSPSISPKGNQSAPVVNVRTRAPEIVVNVNADGLNRTAIRRIVDQRLNETLRGAE